MRIDVYEVEKGKVKHKIDSIYIGKKRLRKPPVDLIIKSLNKKYKINIINALYLGGAEASQTNNTPKYWELIGENLPFKKIGYAII